MTWGGCDLQRCWAGGALRMTSAGLPRAVQNAGATATLLGQRRLPSGEPSAAPRRRNSGKQVLNLGRKCNQALHVPSIWFIPTFLVPRRYPSVAVRLTNFTGARRGARGAWRVVCGEGHTEAELGSGGTGTLGFFGTLTRGGSERWRRRIRTGLVCGEWEWAGAVLGLFLELLAGSIFSWSLHMVMDCWGLGICLGESSFA